MVNPGYVRTLSGVVRSKKKILTAEERKKLLNYLRNKAEKHPSRRNKTNELMVLILDHGLRYTELLNLNIADLPCSHCKSSIVVHNAWNGEIREVYLDDDLETKINKYVEKYRKDAKPNEPLFVSIFGKRTGYNTLFAKLKGRPNYPGLGLAQKLDINNLDATIFRRTLIYQLVGYRDGNSEKAQRKSKAKGVTLRQFMSTCCKGNLSKLDIDFFKKSLNNANNKGHIKLPEHIGYYREGKAKKYSIVALVKRWPAYQKEIQELPVLDSRIAFKMYKERTT